MRLHDRVAPLERFGDLDQPEVRSDPRLGIDRLQIDVRDRLTIVRVAAERGWVVVAVGVNVVKVEAGGAAAVLAGKTHFGRCDVASGRVFAAGLVTAGSTGVVAFARAPAITGVVADLGPEMEAVLAQALALHARVADTVSPGGVLAAALFIALGLRPSRVVAVRLSGLLAGRIVGIRTTACGGIRIPPHRRLSLFR